MSDYQVAFFVGLFGSIHCIGMCGPLMFAVPFTGSARWQLFADRLLYQLGRILSYSLLGAIAGIIGRQVWLSGIQNGLSIVSGVLIVMAGLSRVFKWWAAGSAITAKLMAPLNKLLAYALKHRAGHFAIGMLNGFLPCGFVYLALVGAVNMNSVGGAAGFMLWFGLGTLPLLYAAAIGAGFVNTTVRTRLNRVVPYFMILLGFWFVARGLELNVPYLSPPAAKAAQQCQ